MSNDFYRAFEERYRGSRELIKSRLEIYLPFIIPLKNLTTSPISLDLGCGRGEWLELLAENGFNACGVDLDDEMLKVCRQLGLKSIKNDVVKYLKKEADESHDLISGFHIAEHLPFEKLQTLVSEALRVLKPAGLMILETPNPENIIVSSNNFYMDPTHVRPIPPELLSFVVEYADFFRVKIVRLQESKDLTSNVRLSLMNVLAGTSPDYSVVAQKYAEPDVIEYFDSAFSNEYGITLDFLADNYDCQVENRLMQIETKLNFKNTYIQNLETELNLIKQSKIWRVGTFVGQLFYGKLLGRFPLLQKSAFILLNEGPNVFYIKIKNKLKWNFKKLLKPFDILESDKRIPKITKFEIYSEPDKLIINGNSEEIQEKIKDIIKNMEPDI